MKVALVCTVYNEGDSIGELLDSVVAQTRQPEEAIFVDGGSEDGTQEVIQEYASEHGWIELVVNEGCNIAEGRNRGVEETDADIIATTDGGCVLDEKWLEKLMENFPEADVSAGVFKPKTDGSRFKEVLGVLETPDIENLPEDWPPSSRSQAFKRDAWEAVGGYPEDLYTAEDTEFNRQLKEAGCKYQIARDAVVYWEMRDSLEEVFDQYRLYGRGDAENNTLKGLKSGNYNAVKTAGLLGLSLLALTTPLIALSPLYGVPGLLSLLFLLFYRVRDLGRDALDPRNLWELVKINAAMRSGYLLGFVGQYVRRVL
ncbi:MAG: glycosyltransferase [Candidatus Nanohalobium sp.]